MAGTRLAEVLLETAEDMRHVGVLDAAVHKKITARHLADAPEWRP